MIANFLKIKADEPKKHELLKKLNLSIIPQVGMAVKHNGQYFIVYLIEFSLDTYEYNIYLKRC